jgi:hypothetical protein
MSRWLRIALRPRLNKIASRAPANARACSVPATRLHPKGGAHAALRHSVEQRRSAAAEEIERHADEDREGGVVVIFAIAEIHSAVQPLRLVLEEVFIDSTVGTGGANTARSTSAVRSELHA